MGFRFLVAASAIVTATLTAAADLPSKAAWQTHGPLKVSDNRRFLVHADGTPFFYLGDTAWELFHRLNREEATHYLEDRARKGFTVIQAVALAELAGLTSPNAYGHLPLLENDPARPDTQEGQTNDYWDHVDFIVDQAETLGLIIGFLPTWGTYWNKPKGEGGIFDPVNAETYGRWLGERYRPKPIIWVLGGDRLVQDDRHRDIIRAMARGLRSGDGSAHLMTFHPSGNRGSAESFHDEDWLDFNMRQNGHAPEFSGRYENTRADYDRTPPKPVIDAEPIYEDHPVSFNAREHGHSVAADVRRALYWDLFGGACGHTYGHHSIWQMFEPGKHKPINDPLMWREALDQPGAGQMRFGRVLLESRPVLTRVPDDSVIVAAAITTAIPGTGTRHFAATRDSEGRFAMIYAPVGRPFTVRMNAIKGAKVKAWWFDPRTGEAQVIGEFSNTGNQTFTPPNPGELLDWVLVLDDAAEGFSPPGH